MKTLLISIFIFLSNIGMAKAGTIPFIVTMEATTPNEEITIQTAEGVQLFC